MVKPAAVLVLAILAQAAAPSDTLTAELAAAFERKLAAIVDQAPAPPRPGQPRRTVLPQDELNAYLRLRGPDVLPSGVGDASLHAADQGRLSARAVVDLDAMRRQSSGSWLDPRAYLSGRLPVMMSGTLDSSHGVARFTIERAEVGGVSVPPAFVYEIVAYYSPSAEYPQGIDLVKGFTLPAAIERLVVEPGRLIVVQ